MAYDEAAFKLRGDSARLNFRRPNPRTQNHKALHPSVEAKLETICEDMSKSQKNGRSTKPKKSPAKAKAKAKAKNFAIATASASASDSGSGGSSPLSDLTFGDGEGEDLVCDKFFMEDCPSHEIDWEALLSS